MPLHFYGIFPLTNIEAKTNLMCHANLIVPTTGSDFLSIPTSIYVKTDLGVNLPTGNAIHMVAGKLAISKDGIVADIFRCSSALEDKRVRCPAQIELVGEVVSVHVAAPEIVLKATEYVNGKTETITIKIGFLEREQNRYGQLLNTLKAGRLVQVAGELGSIDFAAKTVYVCHVELALLNASSAKTQLEVKNLETNGDQWWTSKDHHTTTSADDEEKDESDASASSQASKGVKRTKK